MPTTCALQKSYATVSNALPIRRVMGVPVHAITMSKVIDIVENAISCREQLQIGVVNAAKVLNMKKDALLRADVLGSDLILADGMSVVWASRLLRQSLPERVPGIDLMHEILRRGEQRGWRIFCLGATDEVLRRVKEKISEQYPGVKVVGTRNGYFQEAEEVEVAREISESRPDVIFIAITSPKKERFLGRWSKQLGVPVTHGVGGSFDVMAGKVKRAPILWQRFGCEWAYRLKQEPRRLWKRYLTTNTEFCLLLAKEMLHQTLNSRQSVTNV